MLVGELKLKDSESVGLLLGLSEKNVQGLRSKKPILLSRETHGVSIPKDLIVMIVHGETEADIVKELESHGMVDAKSQNLTDTPIGQMPRCCVSSHDPPDTACQDFLLGHNQLTCVYCDHEEKCHPGPGATCEIGRDAPRKRTYPEGRLGPDDDGSVPVRIAHDDDKKVVIVTFPESVTWMAMNADQAMQMGHTMVKHAVALKPELKDVHMPFCTSQDQVVDGERSCCRCRPCGTADCPQGTRDLAGVVKLMDEYKLSPHEIEHAISNFGVKKNAAKPRDDDDPLRI